MSKSQGKAQKTSEGANRTTGEFNKTFKTSNNILNKTSGIISNVTDGLKSFGIISMVASGGMAAWGINASNSARDLTRLSHSLQLSTEEIQAMGSVYQQVGGTMEEFAKDADSFYRMTGQSLDLEKIVELSERFKGLSDAEALNLGRAFGLSDSLVRLMQQGEEAIRGMADEAQRMAHVNTAEQIEKLNALSVQWNNTKETISGVSTAFQAGLSEGMTPALELLTKAMAENQASFEEWGQIAGGIVDEAMSRFLGVRSKLQQEMDELREKEKDVVQAEVHVLEESTANFDEPTLTDERLNKIKKTEEQIPAGASVAWDTLVDALPIYSQRTITGSIDAVKKGWRRLSEYSDIRNDLDAERTRTIESASPEQKIWLAKNSEDKRVRRKLIADGWGSEDDLPYNVHSDFDTPYSQARFGKVATGTRGEGGGYRDRRFKFNPVQRERSVSNGGAYELPVTPGQSVINNSTGDTNNSQSTTVQQTFYVDIQANGNAEDAGAQLVTGGMQAAKTFTPGTNK